MVTQLDKTLSTEGIGAVAIEKPLKRPSTTMKVVNNKGKKGKAPIRKPAKFTRPLTNTHLKDQIDLTKDYVPSSGPSTSTKKP